MDNIEIDKIDKMLSEFRLIDTEISNKFKVIYGKHEVWRTVKDCDNYSVSSFGRVRNDKFNRILKPLILKGYGYHYVQLSKKGKTKNHNIHRLVGIAFLPNHDNLPIVDHVDSKQFLINNIINLRWATFGQNGFNQGKQKNNTSGFKGVSWCKRTQKYEAGIKIKGKKTRIGYFLTAQDAGHAYDEYAKKHHGEFYYKNKN